MIDLEQADLGQVEARIVTTKGVMVAGFHPDKAPAHVRNFLTLAQDGFYDRTAFHRIIKGFMIQGGCPNSKPDARGVPGTGGPGHKVHAEFNDLPHVQGVLSMARSQDPNSAGSQFFVVHSDHAEFLDGQYTVFGQLREGLDVLDAIATTDVEFGESGERSRPTERIEIERIDVVMAAPPAEADPAAAPDSDSDSDGDGEGDGDGDGGGD